MTRCASLFIFVLYVLHFNNLLANNAQRLPNIVLILADDLDEILGGTKPLQKTKALLEKNGMRFENSFATTPLCCPSRSSLLTGRYVHSHGTRNNSIDGGCSSPSWQAGPETNTFPVALKSKQYTTFYAGKYLNKYGLAEAGGVKHIPPGWDWWNALVGNSIYYNYTLSVNGTEEIHGDNPETDYLTSVITKKAVSFLNSFEGSNDSHFFMMLSPPCPHAPFTPLPEYAKEFSNATAPRTLNFNVPGGKTKHWLVRQPPSPLPENIIDEVDDIFRNRWRTLLSLDDLVETVVNTLDKKGFLPNTYIFLTSDNGYHMGQFSLPWDKRQPYEFDIRVPLIVRGPGIPNGVTSQAPVVNLDLAPTILELAGLVPPEVMEGRSLLPLFVSAQLPETYDSQSWRSNFTVEHFGEGLWTPVEGCPKLSQGGVKLCLPDCICQDAFNNSYTCIRTLSAQDNNIMCHFHDDELFKEEYDLTVDPFQMKNLAFRIKVD